MGRDSLDAFRRSENPSRGRPLVLAHRGARRDAPENTLVAFDEALRQGADGVELDVRTTCDGHLVVAHDDELPLGATSTGGHPIGSEKERVRIGQLFAAQLRHVRLPSGEAVPSLEEVLDWRRRTGALLNVELKRDVASRLLLVEKTAALLRKLGTERVLVSSFDPRIVWGVSRQLPEVPVAWLTHRDQHRLGRDLGYRLVGALEQRGDKEGGVSRWLEHGKRLGTLGVHPELGGIDERRVKRLLATGVLVNVWTVNEVDDARRLAQLGVDGIITDVPGQILAGLERA